MWPAEARDQLRQRLESERTALESLLAEHARIADHIARKRVRVEFLEELLGGSKSSGRQSRASRGTGGLKGDSRVARAHAYLRGVGESKHVRDILEGIGEPDTPRERNGLSTQINRHVEKGRFFVRDEARGARFFAVMVEDHAETPE